MAPKITTVCPSCNAKLAVSQDRAGKLLRCPQCQSTVRVPHDTNGTMDSPEAVPDSKVEARPAASLIIIPAVNPVNDEQDLTVKVRRKDGGSIKTVLSTRIILNEHSTLRREWITITDPLVPAELVQCTGLVTTYQSRSDYDAGGYFYESEIQLKADEDITAFQVKFLTFDVWGEHVCTLVSTDIRDLFAGVPFFLKSRWQVYSENEVSEFLASIAFVARVRTRDGRVINADTQPVMEEALRFKAKLKDDDFQPTKSPQR